MYLVQNGRKKLNGCEQMFIYFNQFFPTRSQTMAFEYVLKK
jgi:hypothetical protein